MSASEDSHLDAAGRSGVTRRDLLGRGLAGGVSVLLGGLAVRASEGESASYPDSAVHRPHPLEFRLDSDYRPDLSDAAAERLARATVAFLKDEHPQGRTIAFWNAPPSRMPFLARHLELVVENTFAGIRDTLAIRPVDPIALLSVFYNESRFHPKVISPAGAAGMAQFMPPTAKQFGLTPLGRTDEWSRYRDARAAHRKDRRSRIRSFLAGSSVARFDPELVVRRAIEASDWEMLRDYLAILEQDDPSRELLTVYIDGLKADLAPHEFFWDGQEELGRIDGRVSYRSVRAAVRYLAQRLSEHQGMISTAVAAYNAGPDAVRVRSSRSILHRFGSIPDYSETVRYVQRFLAAYSAIKYQVHRLGDA